MAVPINTADDLTIFIVDISMGSQFRGTSRDLDEYTREIKYKHGKNMRNRIGAVRQTVNVAVAGTCMKFYKTRFTNSSGKAALEQACLTADREMKSIDASLHVTPLFYKIEVSALSSGNMFDQMKEQLSVQVHQRVLDRVKVVIENNRKDDGTYKPITGKTRTALLTMLEKVGDINILNDPNVTTRIEAMKAQIQQNSLIPLRDEILAYIEDVQGAENLEISPDVPGQNGTEDDISTVTPEQKAAGRTPRPLNPADEIHIEDLI